MSTQAALVFKFKYTQIYIIKVYKRAGLINYRRGHISVLDRNGLEKQVCECYAVVKKEMNRLLSDVQYRQNI